MAAIMRELSHRGYQTKTPSGQQLLNDLLAQAVNSPEYSQTVRPKTYLRADAEQDLPHPVRGKVWMKHTQAQATAL